MKNTYFTQKELVLLHLKNNGKITCLDAIKEYNILYLTKAIQLLRKEGCNIKDKWICYITNDNIKKKYKLYYIGNEKQDAK